MQYNNTIHGLFLSRPNRFIANVDVNGSIERVHVKNTGRCRELLIPGADVVLEISDNPKRKTKYDLVMVWKPSVGWVNIDSQAPNKIALEWLQAQNYEYIKPEYRYGNSRIDFYMEKNGEKYLCEVKGCTLEVEGQGYFPDAPTERGAKHFRELAGASKAGYHSILAYVIQMNDILTVKPNTETDPKYAEAWKNAARNGVEILFIPCRVTENQVWAEAEKVIRYFPQN